MIRIASAGNAARLIVSNVLRPTAIARSQNQEKPPESSLLRPFAQKKAKWTSFIPQTSLEAAPFRSLGGRHEPTE
jgi:hypothetical protein